MFVFYVYVSLCKINVIFHFVTKMTFNEKLIFSPTLTLRSWVVVGRFAVIRIVGCRYHLFARFDYFNSVLFVSMFCPNHVRSMPNEMAKTRTWNRTCC